MIRIYYRASCNSSRRAVAWFEKYGIEVQKYKISELNRKELVKLLSNSDEGILDIVKHSGKISLDVNKAINYMMDMTFNKALDFLLSHTILLQTPIILEENNWLVGYNEDEIRKFLPKEYRRYTRR